MNSKLRFLVISSLFFYAQMPRFVGAFFVAFCFTYGGFCGKLAFADGIRKKPYPEERINDGVSLSLYHFE